MRSPPLVLALGLAVLAGCGDKSDPEPAEDSGLGEGHDDSGAADDSAQDTGDDSAEDSDHADTSADTSDTSDSGPDDSAVEATWAGTWAGTVTFSIEEGGFTAAYGSCTADVQLVLPAEVDGLEVIGQVQLECSPPSMTAGVIGLRGNAVSETDWSGAVQAVVNYGTGASTFAGTFSGDTLSVTIQGGVIPGGGELYWRWEQTSVTLTREE